MAFIEINEKRSMLRTRICLGGGNDTVDPPVTDPPVTRIWLERVDQGGGGLGRVRVVAQERVFYFYPKWVARAAPIVHALISGPILCFVWQRKTASYSG